MSRDVPCIRRPNIRYAMRVNRCSGSSGSESTDLLVEFDASKKDCANGLLDVNTTERD